MKARNLTAIAMICVMLAAAFSGCTGGKDNTGGTGGTGGTDGTGGNDTGNQTGGNGTGNQTAHTDYSAEYSDFVGDMQNYEYSMQYAFPVDNGAKQATIYVKIGTEGGGLPFPAGCYITVTVKDSAGSDTGSATLDPTTATEATITLTSFKSYGNYTVDISGYGMSGMGYGGKYDLKIDVKYS